MQGWKNNIQREAVQISRQVLHHMSRNIFRTCKACLEAWRSAIWVLSTICYQLISWGNWYPNYQRTGALYASFHDSCCAVTHTHIYTYMCVCVYIYIYIYLKATLFYVFLNWNCGCILNLRRYFSLFKKSWKHYFPQRTRIVNFTDSELYLLAKIVHSHNKFLNAKRLMLYHTIHTKHNLLSENHP